MNKIRHFNDSAENIAYITNHNAATFIITCEVFYNYKGRISEIEFNGYDLKMFQERSHGSKSFIYLRSEAVYNTEHDYLKNLFIRDFRADITERDKGYGGVMLEQFIKYANSLNAPYISGEFSFEDIGTDNDNDLSKKQNRERLYHFYPKHGFIITEDEKIHLQLKGLR